MTGSPFLCAGSALQPQPILASSQALLACASYFASPLPAAHNPGDADAAGPAQLAGVPQVEEVLAAFPKAEGWRP